MKLHLWWHLAFKCIWNLGNHCGQGGGKEKETLGIEKNLDAYDGNLWQAGEFGAAIIESSHFPALLKGYISPYILSVLNNESKS